MSFITFSALLFDKKLETKMCHKLRIHRPELFLLRIQELRVSKPRYYGLSFVDKD